jgi:hypothetical protein
MLGEESDHETANYISQQNYGNVEETKINFDSTDFRFRCKICASCNSFCVLNFEPQCHFFSLV